MNKEKRSCETCKFFPARGHGREKDDCHVGFDWWEPVETLSVASLVAKEIENKEFVEIGFDLREPRVETESVASNIARQRDNEREMVRSRDMQIASLQEQLLEAEAKNETEKFKDTQIERLQSEIRGLEKAIEKMVYALATMPRG